jgi:hypothetical protein
MKEVYDGMKSKSSKVNKTLVYGNNETSKVSKVAALGQLREVAISSSISDNIVSVSQLAALGYTVVFSKAKAHILGKNYEMMVKKDDIVKTCKCKNGLYNISINDLVEMLNDDVEDEEASDDGMAASDDE